MDILAKCEKYVPSCHSQGRTGPQGTGAPGPQGPQGRTGPHLK